MDTLPMEMVESIAQYLTVRDLAACCSTSHTWREMFGQDSIWKHHCNREVAEYLTTAESRVEPKFVSPENELVENSLSALGKWRLAYLREHLLWSHWKNLNVVTEILGTNTDTEEPVILCENGLFEFVTNDYVITTCGKRVILWNISSSPVYVSDPFRLLPGTVTFYSTFDNNKIVIVQKTVVRVYNYGSPMRPHWTLERSFLFDRAVPSQFNVKKGMKTFPYTFRCLLIENYFVGILESGEMHIWNLTSGTKLKKIWCPCINNYRLIGVKKSKKPSKDFAIIIRSSMYHLYVFSLTSMEFYPFYISHNLQLTFSAIQNGLLAISLDDCFEVYDYYTFQLVLVVPAEYTYRVLTLDEYFLLPTKNTIHIFHTITAAFESVLLGLDPYEDISCCNYIVCGKFFVISGNRYKEHVWEIDLKSTPIKITHLGEFVLKFGNHYAINKACTRIAQTEYTEREQFVLIKSLW